MNTPHATAHGGDHAVRVPASNFRPAERFVELVIVPEQEGGFSAYVPSLPGVRSQGDDELDAFASIEEALRATIDAYTEAGQDVPWLDEYPEEPSREHRCKWIRLDA